MYEDGNPFMYGVIPIGGEDVTKDISIGMQIDMREAENLKVDYGMITEDEATKDDQLDVKFLEEIIGSRYLEIFEKINDRLVAAGKDGRLP